MTLDDACGWFDLEAEDTAEVVVAAAQIAADVGLSSRVADVVRQLSEHFEELKPWKLLDLPALFDPVTEPNAPPALRWLYVVAFAEFLPTTLEAHARRGVPEAMSRATLADVGRHVQIARRPSTGLSATERRTVSEPAAASWHRKSGASPLGLAARRLR